MVPLEIERGKKRSASVSTSVSETTTHAEVNPMSERTRNRESARARRRTERDDGNQLTSNSQDPSLLVLHGLKESLLVGERSSLSVGGDESEDGKSSLLGGESVGGVREIGKDEDGDDGEDNGSDTLNDELEKKRERERSELR